MRTGVAVTLLVAVAAGIAAFAALVAALRDDEPSPGRVLQTRMTNAYRGDPVSFPLDDLYVSPGTDGRLHALYVYPPGFYGHARGCKVVWVPDDAVGAGAARSGPGHFVDPCGGARFDRDGRLVQGPADRGLDYFATRTDVGGTVVDTHVLYCGPAGGESGRAATPGGDGDECERVSSAKDFR